MSTPDPAHSSVPRRRAVYIPPSVVKQKPGASSLSANLQDGDILDHEGRDAGGEGEYTNTYRLKVIRQTYAPGGTHFPHHHELAEQAYYIISGKARVRIGDKTFEPEPGTVFYIPPGTDHEVWNIGNEPLVNVLIDVKLDKGEPVQ